MSSEGTIIDLKSHPLFALFFEGWNPLKAQVFAKNLLLIGIGVAYKLLNSSSPEESFLKLNQMAQNVADEYTNLDYLAQKQCQFPPSRKGIKRKEIPLQYTENSNINQGIIQKYGNDEEGLKQEIERVKQRLEELSEKLRHQGDQIRNEEQFGKMGGIKFAVKYQKGTKWRAYPNHQSETRSNRHCRKNSLTPKITESPPPHLSAKINKIYSSGSLPHLNGEAVKYCMHHQNDEYDYYQRNDDSYENYDNTRNPLNQNRVFGNSNQFSTASMPRTPKKLNEIFQSSSGNNFLQQDKSKQNSNKNHQHQQKQKKNVNKYIVSPQDIYKPNYNEVESRIKDCIQADKDQYYQNQDEDRTIDPDDFKQMMLAENQQQNQQKLQEQQPKESENQKENKKKDIANEMGVFFSKEAQKKFFEKKEAEKKKKELLQKQSVDQKKRFKSGEQFKQQIPQQATKQPSNLKFNHQNKKQDYHTPFQNQYQQSYQNQTHLGSSSVREQLINNQNKVQQQDSQRQNIQGDQVADPLEQNPQSQNEVRDNITDPFIGGQQNMNALDIATSFLSSQLMKQLNEEAESDVKQIQNQHDQQARSPQVLSYKQIEYIQNNKPFLKNPNNKMQQAQKEEKNNFGSTSEQATNNNFYPSNQQSSQEYYLPNQDEQHLQQIQYNSSQQYPSFNPSSDRQYNEVLEQQQYQTQLENQIPSYDYQQMNQQTPFLSPDQRSILQMMQSNTTISDQLNSGRKPQNITKGDSRGASQNPFYQQTQQSLKFSRFGNQQSGNLLKMSGELSDDRTYDSDPKYSGYIIPNENHESGSFAYPNQQQQQHQKLHKSQYLQQNPYYTSNYYTQMEQSGHQLQQQLQQQQQPASQERALFKNDEVFRESINNSDFTMPNEEIQQFFKNQNFHLK